MQADCCSHINDSSRAKNQISGSKIEQDHLPNEFYNQTRQTKDYPTETPIFLHMKLSSIMTKLLRKIYPKVSSLGYQGKSNLATSSYIFSRKKIKLVFTDDYFLIVLASKQQLPFPILQGRKKAETYQSLNKDPCQRVGIFLLQHFLHCSCPHTDYQEKSQVFFVHSSLLVLKLNLFVKCLFRSRKMGEDREECACFIEMLSISLFSVSLQIFTLDLLDSCIFQDIL